MNKKILLNRKKSKYSSDTDSFISVPLESSQTLLPVNDAIENVDLYNVYDSERDNCNTYRLVFTINPLCSNILFNNITEVVYKEGSDEVWRAPIGNETKDDYKKKVEKKVIEKAENSTETLNTVHLIRDTEYSHPEIGPLVYHCGVDIFNNHMLRNKTFKLVAKRVNESTSEGKNPKEKFKEDIEGGDNKKDWFNTIGDQLRLFDGTNVKDYNLNVSGDNSTQDGPKKILHLYQIDEINDFNTTFNEKLNEENGWFGFINKSYIAINNGPKMININKVMNNNKSCEQYDLYPDRSLFSFTPKVNKYRKNRLEYNWEYRLTYPYESTKWVKAEDEDNLIYSEERINAIKIIHFEYDNLNGRIYFTSPIRHNLNEGTYIRLYIGIINDDDDDDENVKLEKIDTDIIVRGIGNYRNDDADYIFSINSYDLDDFIDFIDLNTYKNKLIFRFVKVVNGFECEYYFRKFRPIPNVKHLKENIYDDDFEWTEGKIEECNKKSNDFNSTLNKLAFAKNIYNDDLSQITYTDDINITKLKDNLGRPLSEIYLTIIKTNKGHDIWYPKDDYSKADIGNEKIEFSHCFGEVTSGLKIFNQAQNIEDDYKYFDIKRLTNIQDLLEKYASTPLENDITADKEYFFGDICEYNIYTQTETILAEVYHRFNTAQREYNNDYFKKIYYDKFLSDDFEIKNGETEDVAGFKIEQEEEAIMLNPEGYYYKAHYRVQLKEWNETIEYADNRLIELAYRPSKTEGGEIRIKTAHIYYFNVGDIITCAKKSGDSYEIRDYRINKMEGLTKIYIKDEDSFFICNEDGKLLEDIIFLKKNVLSPEYGRIVPDFSFRTVWKTPIKPSELSFESDLYNTTFTNGAFYVNTNINFYLRRQNPNSVNYWSNEYDPKNNSYNIKGESKNIDAYEYVEEDSGWTC